MNVFSKKTLRAEIQTTNGDFIIGKSRVINIVDFPMDVEITKVFGAAGLSANIKIYGASKSVMEAMTRLKWQEYRVPMKAIRIFADDGNGEKLLYEGNIVSADPIYNAPNVYIDIQSDAGAYYNLLSDIPPSSLPGTAPVPISDVFKKIANDFGVGFRNNGVTGVCYEPYFGEAGLYNRIRAAAIAHNVDYVIHNKYVEIFPQDMKYSYKKVWNITKDYYIGYPIFTDAGIRLTLDTIIDISAGD